MSHRPTAKATFRGPLRVKPRKGTADDAILLLANQDETQTWYMGVDESDSDKLLIGVGSAVGTTPRLTLETSADVLTLGTTDSTQNKIKGELRMIGNTSNELSIICNATTDRVLFLNAGVSGSGGPYFSLRGSTAASNAGDFDLANSAGENIIKYDDSASSIALMASAGTKRVEANDTGIGFFAATPVAKPTVTGAHASNAALVSLLTALANLGLITDSSS